MNVQQHHHYSTLSVFVISSCWLVSCLDLRIHPCLLLYSCSEYVVLQILFRDRLRRLSSNSLENENENVVVAVVVVAVVVVVGCCCCCCGCVLLWLLWLLCCCCGRCCGRCCGVAVVVFVLVAVVVVVVVVVFVSVLSLSSSLLSSLLLLLLVSVSCRLVDSMCLSASHLPPMSSDQLLTLIHSFLMRLMLHVYLKLVAGSRLR